MIHRVTAIGSDIQVSRDNKQTRKNKTLIDMVKRMVVEVISDTTVYLHTDYFGRSIPYKIGLYPRFLENEEYTANVKPLLKRNIYSSKKVNFVRIFFKPGEVYITNHGVKHRFTPLYDHMERFPYIDIIPDFGEIRLNSYLGAGGYQYKTYTALREYLSLRDRISRRRSIFYTSLKMFDPDEGAVIARGVPG